MKVQSVSQVKTEFQGNEHGVHSFRQRSVIEESSNQDKRFNQQVVLETDEQGSRSITGQQVNQAELEKKLLDLERTLEFLNRRFDYRVHEETGRLMVAIIDKQTGEVVRTVPPERLLDIAAKIREFVGLIIDERY